MMQERERSLCLCSQGASGRAQGVEVAPDQGEERGGVPPAEVKSMNSEAGDDSTAT